MERMTNFCQGRRKREGSKVRWRFLVELNTHERRMVLNMGFGVIQT